MGLLTSLDFSYSSWAIFTVAATALALALRILQNLYLHPLSKYPGPWYAASFSLTSALVSVLEREPQWLMSLVEKYGTDQPIRISPSMLLFPKSSSLKEIYWDPKCNQKSGFYGSGVLGPPHLFTTLDGDEHRALRKALSNAPWSIGQLKNTWEPRFDDQINLLVQKMTERSKNGDIICISDKMAEFAADIMSMITFTQPFGFVENGYDVKEILTNWRKGLRYFGFANRFRFFRNYIMKLPVVNLWLLPRTSNESGMGWLMCEAERQVTRREKLVEEQGFSGKPDLLQHCIEAQIDGKPLTSMQRRAHITLLIQAGADTTGTALGSTLRYIVTNPAILEKVREEIEEADKAGKLSSPVQFEEVKTNLPYFVACIKEGLRLDPPATNLFARVAPSEGKTVNGHFIPPGSEMTSNAYVVHRDSEVYGPDPEAFRPERWLESQAKHNEMEALHFGFGMGPRICLGKDIAIMELYKLLPEFVRRFDIHLIDKGRYVVVGGIAYNQNFLVKLKVR